MRPGRKGYSREVKSRAISAVLDGNSYSRAARDMGVDKDTVRRWCREAGIASHARPGPAPGLDPQGETGISRRAYLLRILREALPEAVRAAREKFRNHVQ